MRVQLSLVPDEVINQYNLRQLAEDGWVYIEIRKGMPGLKQAGKVANKRLTEHLTKYGYQPVARNPALWKHTTRQTTFTLCVDDFGVKYCDKQTQTICSTHYEIYTRFL